mgnify:CR=1 FL=1
MTVREFSEQFDILYNNIMSNKAPGLSEYEKSVLLTQAQEEIVRGLYTGNISKDSFEETEELKRYLNTLITTRLFTVGVSPDIAEVSSTDLRTYNHHIYEVTQPSNILYRIYEEAGLALCNNGIIAEVKSVAYEDLYNFVRNPFQRPSTKRVLRVDKGLRNNNTIFHLYSQYPLTEYSLTFLRKPKPIILEDLDTDTIDGESTAQTSELDSSIHKMILDLAVQQAKSIWQ